MNWFKRILGRNSPDSPPEKSSGWDESFSANSDVLEGVEFQATLQLRTPLCVIEHHGEIFLGPPSEAPRYGTKAQGIWVLRTKSFRDLGLDIDDFSSGQHASELGYVDAGEFLPFLKAFRQIVESTEPVTEKISQIESLGSRSAKFEEFLSRLKSSSQDFPDSFFYSELAELPGIGIKSAKALFEAGFHSKAALQSASEGALAEVPGLGKKTIEKLKKSET